MTDTCSLLVLNAPDGLQFGIDYCMWRTGPKFMGIRAVPPGAHFLYWSLDERIRDAEEIDDREVEKDNEFRTGIFVYMEPGQVIVKQWEMQTETFVNLETEDEEMRFIEGVNNHDFDLNLGPYPTEWLIQWKEVSRFISREVIERIEPLNKLIWTSMKEYPDNDVIKDNKELSGFENGLLYFCDIPKPKINPGSSAADITRLSHDRSEAVNSIINETMNGDANQLLGEIQFSYVCFLLSFNFEAFQHWKSLIILLCHCETVVQQQPQLFSDFIRVLYCHLTQAPEDLFSDCFSSDNFFIQCLSSLCEICADPSLPTQLRKRVEFIKASLDPQQYITSSISIKIIVEKFGVSINDLLEGSEEAPTIVNLEHPFYNFDDDVIQE